MMRSCIFCKHFDLDMGFQGYSELTPGEEASVNCDKKVFRWMNLWEIPARTFADWTMTCAKECEHYEERELFEN